MCSILLIKLIATETFERLLQLLLLSGERWLKGLALLLQDGLQPVLGRQSMIGIHPAPELPDRRGRRLLLGELDQRGFGEIAGAPRE